MWPEGLPGSPGRRWVPLFVPRPAFRKLRVVIDAEVLARAIAPGASDPDALFASLVHHKYVSLLRYADAGPSAEDIAKGGSPMAGVPDGWLVGPKNPPSAASGYAGCAKFWVDGAGSIVNCSFGAAASAAEDLTSTSYAGRSPSDAVARRSMDAVAAACAHAVGADLFITRRPYLFEPGWDRASGVLAISPLDALPLLGLYLRAQDVFTVRQTSPGSMGAVNMNRGSFYTLATYDLLPSLGRWFGAVEAHALAVDDDALAQLAVSLVRRFQQGYRTEIESGLL